MKYIALILCAFLVGCVTEALQRRMDDTRAEIQDLEKRLALAEDDETAARLGTQLEVATARLEEQKVQAVVERKEYVANFATKAGGITKIIGGIVNSFNPAIGGILGVLGLGFGAFGGALTRKNGATG